MGKEDKDKSRCHGQTRKDRRDDTPLASRRGFLLTTTAGAVAAVIGSCGAEESGAADGGPDENGTDGDTEGVNDDGPTGPVTPPPDNRVVRVVDPEATTWDGGDATDFYQYTVQSVVDAMFEEGLTSLTNTDSLEAAWQALVPYQDGELVAVHINAYVNTQNDRKNNVGEPISAIVHGLVDILGIPADRVAVVDPSRNLVGSPAEERIISRCVHADALSWDLHRGEHTSLITFTEGQAPPREERLARVIDEADHVIMVPVLSWHSGFITGAMKMMMGSISDMGALHDSGGDEGLFNGAGLADICMPFNNKVRLIVADGLYGNIDSNSSSPHAFQTLGGSGGAHPSSALYFSRDMVSIDCVMYDDILDEAKAANRDKGSYSTGFLRYAADENHQLGTFEMKNETGGETYTDIDFIEIVRT
jgi:uncharacterized protein (DUF362 family)